MSLGKHFKPSVLFGRKNEVGLFLLSRIIRCFAIVFWLTPVLLHAVPATWYVDATVSGTNGSGTSGDSCKTIGTAIAKSGTSDTVIVRSGTYREFLQLNGGTAASPYTLRSDTNARVIVTGFNPLPASGNWTVYSSGSAGTVYTAAVNWAARDLFIGNLKQRIARVPAVGQPWAVVQSYTNNIVTLTSSLGVTLSGTNTGSCFAYVWSQSGDYYTAFPVLSASGSTITLAASASIAKNDTLVLANHPSFCQATGDWAYTALTGSTTQLYYQTANSADLDTLQSRKVGIPISIANKSCVLVDGIEVSGGGQPGIRVTSSTNATIQNCIVHHNSMETAGYGVAGILTDSCNNVIIQNTIVCNNGSGIASSRTNLNITGTSSGLTIRQCEVAYNEGDGIDIAGTGSFANPTNALVQQCYVHNSIGQEHPDDLQIYTDVSNLTVDSCFFTQAGQNIMSQENNGVTVTNNVFSCSLSRSVIVGHGDSRNWTFRNNTHVWPNGQTAIGMDVSSSGAPNLTARNDLYYNAKMMYTTGTTPAPVFDTDYSVYWSGTGSTDYVASRSSPWTNYLTVGGTSSQLYLDLSQELHSYKADPMLRNAPRHIAIAKCNSTLTTLYLSFNFGNSTTGFNVNDYIEVNGDGIPRKITGVTTGTSITIDTPLSDYVSQRGWLVVNWGPTPSLDGTGQFKPMDTRLPAGSAYLTKGDTGGPIGSTIDTTAYVNGDFDGDGVREIPTLPDDIKASWITYGSFPYFGVTYSGLSINSPSITNVASGTTNCVFTVSVAPTAQTVQVAYSSSNGTAIAGTDYVAVSGTLTFAPFTTLQTITVPVIGNPLAQPTKTFTVKLSNANATISASQGTGTILTTSGSVLPPVINSGLTATGTNGSDFSYNITATNNPTSFDATGLPSDLSVDPATGTISGTPLVTGTFPVTISAINSSGTGSATLTLTIQPPPAPPVLTSPLTATGTSGFVFNYTITADNNPTSFDATGLPAGLSVDALTGIISGTPTTTGTFSATISASNSFGSDSGPLEITIIGAHFVYDGFDYPVTNNISTSPASSTDIGLTGTWSGSAGNDKVISPGLSYAGIASIGNALQFTVNTASTRSIDMSAVPAGYTQVDTDSVTRLGKPGTTLWFRFLMRADATDTSGTLNAGLELCGASSGGTTKMKIGDTGTSANWSVIKNTTVGASSVPIVTGSTVLLVTRVTFGTGINTDAIDLYVNPPTWATPPATPDASLRNLSIGTFDRVQFKGNRQSTADELSIGTDWASAVMPSISAPVISSALAATGTIGSAFNYAIAASNSPTSYNATLLPSGLSVNTATGVISGTPTVTGTFSSTISATNVGGTGTSPLMLTVLRPYDSWKTQVFTPTELLDPSISGNTATPGHDGISNLVKYALGLEPKTHYSASKVLPFAQLQTVSGTNYMTFTFTRDTTATDVTYSVEAANDLSGVWTSIDPFVVANQVSVLPNTPAPGIQTITIKDIQPSGASATRFMRLRLTIP